jgi:SNF2 family DNA or RNA helicase
VLEAIGAPDLWPRHHFESRFVDWRPAYQLPTGRWVEKKAIGFLPGKAEEMRDYLRGCMLRRTAEDVGLRLPVRVGERHRWVQLTEAQQAAYDDASKRVGLSAHAARERAGKIHEAESSLVDALMEEIAKRPDEKIVVGCETLDVVEMVTERLTAAGIGNRRIEGQTKTSDRDSAISDFRNEPEVRVLVGSRVLERGLDLQFARVLISLDSSYNPQREHQREGRVCRIGSPHETYEHLTLLPDTAHGRAKLRELERKNLSHHMLLGPVA